MKGDSIVEEEHVNEGVKFVDGKQGSSWDKASEKVSTLVDSESLQKVASGSQLNQGKTTDDDAKQGEAVVPKQQEDLPNFHRRWPDLDAIAPRHGVLLIFLGKAERTTAIHSHPMGGGGDQWHNGRRRSPVPRWEVTAADGPTRSGCPISRDICIYFKMIVGDTLTCRN
ncbi:hypothetical protein GUJ93_ZPchr0001g32578 [Zizania palustris]|uniref:Uncharacterized protein n=1 Tax=Zizania palustris TaxID=103762 RepID=A0A8J5RLB1_ZIZPA|nr:hypothetical protein GUJ93_ZPchr0001g32578 [Zizania palustris]